MAEPKLTVFGRTKALEMQIDELLDRVSEAGIVFETAVRESLTKGVRPEEGTALQKLVDFKHRANELRRSIEAALYTEMLIPDARGDVMSLLEELYDVVDRFADIGGTGSREQPDIPDDCKDDFVELTSTVVKAVEAAVLGSRAYFRDPVTVRDHVHKTSFYESECDEIAARLQRRIFESDLDLAQKLHLKSFVDAIDSLADEAEDIGDALTIFAIKRAE